MRYMLTDDRWAALEPVVRQAKRHKGGQKPVLSDRDFFEAFLYLARTGVAWRDLPGEFDGWDAVYSRFRRWVTSGGLRRVRDGSIKGRGRAVGAEQAPGCSRGGLSTRVIAVVSDEDTVVAVDVVLASGATRLCWTGRGGGRWMAAACETTGLIPITIDGKSARRAKASTATGCLHTVSAWATANGLTLGQVAVPDGSNEIAVVPDLLRTLDLAGAIVTIDAAGCQTKNARLIRAGGGHYLLPVKGSQPTLHAAVQAVLAAADAAGFDGIRFDAHGSAGVGHGRREERMTTVIYDPVGLPPEWPDVAAVALVGRERAVGATSTFASQYYITSHAGTAEELAGLARSHWQIENGLHWVLDVAFREDEGRTRDAKAGANLALLRRVAVSLLKRAAAKGSIRTRRLKAAWDGTFLQQVLKSVSVGSEFA